MDGNRKRYKVLIRLALACLLSAVLVALFFRNDLEWHNASGNFHIHIWSPWSLVLIGIGAVLGFIGFGYQPEFEINTKEVFAVNEAEFTVIRTEPADRYLTIRWADVDGFEWNRNCTILKLSLTTDYFLHEEESKWDVVNIDDVCLSKATPGFELFARHLPSRFHPAEGKLFLSVRASRRKRKKSKRSRL
jgi:hypothetical protein